MSERPRRAPAILVAVIAAAHLAATLCRTRGDVFDDAFITFRYAHNLAFGHGLTWNPGEPPVEGYTNFLLVVALAPAIRLGLDPLWVVRILSAAAAAVLAALVGRDVCGPRRDPWTALLFAGLFVASGTTALVCTTGMETMLFAAALYACFRLGLAATESDADRPSFVFGAAVGAATLLRPEAQLLAVAWTIVALRAHGRAGLRRVALAAAGDAAVLAPYLAWKLTYFGTLLPNPALVKLGDVGLYSPTGLTSIVSALTAFAPVTCAALVGIVMAALSRADADPRDRRARTLAAAVVVVYFAFFLRVDTLMDVYSRFLFPAMPFVFVLAAPALVAAYRELCRFGAVSASVVAALAAVAIADGGPRVFVRDAADVLRGGRSPGITSLMQRERVVAESLARLPEIEDTTIAFCDAGVIAYFTGAKFIDTAGLNDRAIATAATPMDAARSVFARRPTLLLLPMNADGTPSARPHGRLGDGPAWIGNTELPWSRYRYAGTVRDATYDIDFLVLDDWPRAAELADFLRRNVVDDVAGRPAFLR